ncbi:hypothetical protein K503DRAFT_803657 [Rhizopogon vinicolor AM-OR11-026]|uniref:Uncharacterized protein n=1 Tax=Rhizopogon vinicolor AM-OR11-026 TaxID=1314800 RepID=A0A1B7MP36_9AGAM|nr:hypothetical protein K503DRAFT_803657 [Rhizopogon vinicolor AM-OR11-026]
MPASEATASTNDHHTPSASPLLIAPPSSDNVNAKQVTLGSSETVKFDNLGPLVVNNDGTLSRIANWENMTEQERERTMRVLAARNRTRLAKQADQIQ